MRRADNLIQWARARRFLRKYLTDISSSRRVTWSVCAIQFSGRCRWLHILCREMATRASVPNVATSCFSAATVQCSASARLLPAPLKRASVVSVTSAGGFAGMATAITGSLTARRDGKRLEPAASCWRFAVGERSMLLG